METTGAPAPPSTRARPPASSSRSPLSARAFGAHVLLGDQIGRGAMSRVYRGWVRGTGHEVAVKVLRDELATKPDAVRRFVRERELLAAVANAHVVAVHDLVVHGDELGIVMDLVNGGHLRRAIGFPCMLADAARFTAQIADGLAAVHAAGVVHRDLKPENILVDTDDDGSPRLRLTDFGISRLVDSAALTQTSVTGTPGYLAPEVAAGGRVTAAADVYALGVMLYEMCTGRQPFVADNPLLLVLAHTRQAPPRPVDLPDPLWQVLGGMLAKDPEQRPTASAVAADLRAMVDDLSGLPPCAVPPPVPRAEEPATLPAAAILTAPTSVAAAREAVGADGDGVGGSVGAPSVPASAQIPPRSTTGTPRPPAALPTVAPAAVPIGPAEEGAAPGRSARHGSARPDRSVRVPRPIMIAVAAAAAVIALIAALVVLRGGGRHIAVVPVVPTPQSSAHRVVPSPPASGQATSVVPPPAAAPHHGAPLPVTHRSSTATSSTGAKASAAGSATTSPSPTASPQTPVVQSTTSDPHSSDRRAALTISDVSAESGTVSSLTVNYTASGQSAQTQTVDVSAAPATTDYTTTVYGLTDGVAYTFTATVCNSHTLCTTSAPLVFTPYGAPQVQAPTLALSGTQVTVTVAAEVRKSNPGTAACTVSVTSSPADASTPQGQQVSSSGDIVTFTGVAGTVYTATETCATDGVTDGSVTSAPLTVPAV